MVVSICIYEYSGKCSSSRKRISLVVFRFPFFKVFDNVDIDDVVKVALKWEQGAGLIEGNNIAARDKRWATGDSLTLKSAEAVEGLANELCELARENSLDSTKDSPFAMLAKDNDIMWSGGMPDDCTVIVAHVVGQNVEEAKGKK